MWTLSILHLNTDVATEVCVCISQRNRNCDNYIQRLELWSRISIGLGVARSSDFFKLYCTFLWLSNEVRILTHVPSRSLTLSLVPARDPQLHWGPLVSETWLSLLPHSNLSYFLCFPLLNKSLNCKKNYSYLIWNIKHIVITSLSLL